jgi:hypothetical protein
MSATREGVENVRRAALADIVKNRTEILANELKEGGASAEDVASLAPAQEPSTDDPKRPEDVSIEEWAGLSDEDKAAHIKSAEETKAETAPAPEAKADAAPKADDAAPPVKVKIKVDGQELEVDEEQIREAGIRTLQKESAADKRLEEATKARDEAERLRLSVEATVAKLPKAEQPAAKKSDHEMLLEKDALRGVVKKIQYGSEDEAAEALAEYGTKMAALGQSGRLTETELLNILDLREAQKFVKTNYADVMGDDNLKDLFVAKVNKRLAAGDARPYQDICKETGDELRTWRGAPPKADPIPPKGQDGSRAAVLQRKTSTVQVPSAAARLPEKTQPKEPTQSEIIEKIRKARRQE